MEIPFVITVSSLCLVMSIPVYGKDTTQANNAELRSDVAALKGQVTALENNVDQNQADDKNLLQAVIAGLDFTGGISAGVFYTGNAGQGSSDNEWLLSNVLAEISLKDKEAPVGFTAAIGETSTPSILGVPENTDSLDIEYASLRLHPAPGLNIDVGLLQPNAGYENTYTYNNKNTFLGAVASQQPYNAYGVQIGYDFKVVQLLGGYYKDRLADDEYESDGSTPNESWELGVSGSVLGTSVGVYHYHLESVRYLTGMVIERSIDNVDLGFNMDYWKWDSSLAANHVDDSSIGVAFYITPHFGKFSIPVRLEYIDQGKSGIYLESVEAQQIYSVTLSPTYNFLAHAYIRADFGYVRADEGFADSDGNPRSDRLCLAAEIGYTF